MVPGPPGHNWFIPGLNLVVTDVASTAVSCVATVAYVAMTSTTSYNHKDFINTKKS